MPISCAFAMKAGRSMISSGDGRDSTCTTRHSQQRFRVLSEERGGGADGSCEAGLDASGDIGRVARGYRPVARPDNLLEELRLSVAREGMATRAALVEDAAQRPDVRLGVVWAALRHLRAKVVRRPDPRVRRAEVRCQHLRHAQIANLDMIVPAMTESDS